MDFVVRGLSPKPYRHLYGLPDTELAARGVRRYVADANPGFPDRIEMRDANPGETLLLINHVSMEQCTPYKASHAIFIREGAEQAYLGENEIPEVLFSRLLSLRAFDASGMMLDADLAKGDEIRTVIERFFKCPSVTCIHAHNAARGCYLGKIDRN